MRDVLIQEYNGNIETIRYSPEKLNNLIISTSKIDEKYKNIKDFNYNTYIESVVTKNQDEEFLPYEGDNEFEKQLQVSNYGRIRFKDEILEQIDTKPFAGRLYLKDWKKLKEKGIELKGINYVYQMVAKTWLKKPSIGGDCDFDIHHISNDGYDNRPENLIYLTRCEHSKINHRTRE